MIASPSMYTHRANSDTMEHLGNMSSDISDGIPMDCEAGCRTLYCGSGAYPRFQVFCQPTAVVLGLRLLLAVWLLSKAHFSPSDPAKLIQLYYTWQHCISSR